MTDAKQDALKAIAAKWAEEEAAWRSSNRGKVRFYLLTAPDDAPTFSVNGQTDLRAVIAALKVNGIEADAPFMTLDAADAVGGYTGEIAVLLTSVSPILTGILGAWMQSRVGRKVRLKDGDIEVEARSVKEAGELLAMAAEQRLKRAQAKDQ